MEKADAELLDLLAESNNQVKKLYDHHQKLEREVARFARYANYSPSAGLRMSELKKEKLLGMERIMQALRAYRLEHQPTA